MKNKFLRGLPALLLVFGVVLTGCGNGTTSLKNNEDDNTNPFIGIWDSESISYDTLEFLENEWRLGVQHGHYSRSGSRATLMGISYEGGYGGSATATVSGTTLTLVFEGGYYDIYFTKRGDGGNPYAQKGVYIGLISFAGGATDLNNNRLVYLDYLGKDTLFDRLYYSYTKATQAGTALFYAVHKALVNLTANQSTIPADIDSVHVLTFTDGLDNGSFGASNANPLEGKNGIASNDYAAYVKQQIDSRTINGKSITAYSIGVRGSDVTDEAKFNENLGNIASASANVHSLTDFSQLQEIFTNIANSLEVTHGSKFSMKTTQNDPETVVRMTFDVSGTTSAAASGSTRYIEGTLEYSNGVYTLTNIQYSSGITSESGTTIQGTENGSELIFVFNNITGCDPNVDTVKQWVKTPGSNSWQINSEYSAGEATTVEKRTALVYMVLDSSTSLSDYQVDQIKDAARNFINTLYNRTSQ